MAKEAADFSGFTPDAYADNTSVQHDYTIAIFQRLGIDTTDTLLLNYQDATISKQLGNFFQSSGVGLDTNLGQLIHMMGLEEKIARFLRRHNAMGGRLTADVREATQALHLKAAVATQQIGTQIFAQQASEEITALRSTLFPNVGVGRLNRTPSMQRLRVQALGEKIASIRTRFPMTSR